MIYGNVMFKVF